MRVPTGTCCHAPVVERLLATESNHTRQVAAVAAHLAGRGFTQERPYVRMALGRDSIAGNPALVHAIAGPELG